MKVRVLLAAWLLMLLPLTAKTVIRTATIVPDGTPLMKALRDMAAEVTRATDGEVEFKFFPGATIGDEKFVLDNMRSSKPVIHAAAFTGVALGMVVPEVRILEIPWFYSSLEETEFVLAALSDRFVGQFENEGFVHLGWNVAGSVYVYSAERVASVEDMKERKPWIWEGDPLAEEVFRAFDINPIPASLTTVLTSLETGLVDTVYNTPSALIGLLWHDHVNFVVDYPIVHTIGAFVMTQQAFEMIPERYRETVLTLCRERSNQITEFLKAENVRAIETLTERGVESVQPDPDDAALFDEKGEEVAEKLTGKLWDERLMERVMDLQDEFREEHAIDD